MPKVLVVVPSFSHIVPRAFKNFLQIALCAARTCPNWKFAFHVPERQSLPSAMNGAAEIVLAQDFDCLITFDDDCFPPFDCIPRLLEHYTGGLQFVAGMGVMRGYPHTTTVGKWYPQGVSLVLGGPKPALAGHYWVDDIMTTEGEPLFEADFCGMPVCLISKDAFLLCATPWFGTHTEDNTGSVTHDIFFCRRLNAAKIPVMVDTSLKCGHLSEAPVITFENRALARELTDSVQETAHGQPDTAPRQETA